MAFGFAAVCYIIALILTAFLIFFVIFHVSIHSRLVEQCVNCVSVCSALLAGTAI